MHRLQHMHLELARRRTGALERRALHLPHLFGHRGGNRCDHPDRADRLGHQSRLADRRILVQTALSGAVLRCDISDAHPPGASPGRDQTRGPQDLGLWPPSRGRRALSVQLMVAGRVAHDDRGYRQLSRPGDARPHRDGVFTDPRGRHHEAVHRRRRLHRDPASRGDGGGPPAPRIGHAPLRGPHVRISLVQPPPGR